MANFKIEKASKYYFHKVYENSSNTSIKSFLVALELIFFLDWKPLMDFLGQTKENELMVQWLDRIGYRKKSNTK